MLLRTMLLPGYKFQSAALRAAGKRWDPIPNDDQIREELMSLFALYLETYFVRRDLAGTLSLFGPSIGGVGTGADETAYSHEDAVRNFERDIRQAPDRVDYALNRCQISPLSDTSGFLFAELDIETRIQGQSIKIFGLRMTLIARKGPESWLIEHLHVSLPTDVHAGDEAFPLKELEERNIVLERMVTEKTAELIRAQAALEHLAVHDKLTGLYNRSKLDELLESAVASSDRYGHSLSVIMVDIDNFKQVNDSCGHNVGDNVLAEVARLLVARIRKTDHLGRWGGEEFLLLCPDTNLDEAFSLAEDLRRLLGSGNLCAPLAITGSFGVASYQKGDTPISLLERADMALYAAKRDGKDCVRSLCR